MKISLAMFLLLSSTQAFALSQFNCRVAENVNPPLETRSEKYTVNAPFTDPVVGTQLNLNAIDLDLSISAETFQSQVIAPGQQAVIVEITDNKTGGKITANGYGQVSTFYDTGSGSFFIQCTVQ
jgi:hypothetical protein